MLGSLWGMRITSSMLWGKMGSGLSVLLSVHKHLRSMEKAAMCLCRSIYSPARGSGYLLLFLWHHCGELLLLAVFAGLSIGPVKFWRLWGEWNLSLWHAEAGLVTGDSSACPGLFWWCAYEIFLLRFSVLRPNIHIQCLLCWVSWRDLSSCQAMFF